MSLKKRYTAGLKASFVMQAIAKYDKLKVVQRLQSGRRKAKKQGKSIGGQARLGKDPKELKMIERVKELRFPKGKRRMSLQKLRIN